MALTDNLEYFLEFENNGNDATPAGLNFTNNNGATFAVGIVGQSTSLASASIQYWSRADSAAIRGGNRDWTFNLWINLTSSASARTMFSKINSGTGSYEFIMNLVTATTKFRLQVLDGAGAPVATSDSTTNYANSTWFMITCGYDSVTSGGQAFIAVNDSTRNTGNKSANPGTTTGAMLIGARDDSLTESLSMNGLIDQFGFWSRVLTTGEQTTLYNGGAGLSYAQMLSTISTPRQPASNRQTSTGRQVSSNRQTASGRVKVP